MINRKWVQNVTSLADYIYGALSCIILGESVSEIYGLESIVWLTGQVPVETVKHMWQE